MGKRKWELLYDSLMKNDGNLDEQKRILKENLGRETEDLTSRIGELEDKRSLEIISEEEVNRLNSLSKEKDRIAGITSSDAIIGKIINNLQYVEKLLEIRREYEEKKNKLQAKQKGIDQNSLEQRKTTKEELKQERDSLEDGNPKKKELQEKIEYLDKILDPLFDEIEEERKLFEVKIARYEKNITRINVACQNLMEGKECTEIELFIKLKQRRYTGDKETAEMMRKVSQEDKSEEKRKAPVADKETETLERGANESEEQKVKKYSQDIDSAVASAVQQEAEKKNGQDNTIGNEPTSSKNEGSQNQGQQKEKSERRIKSVTCSIINGKIIYSVETNDTKTPYMIGPKGRKKIDKKFLREKIDKKLYKNIDPTLLEILRGMDGNDNGDFVDQYLNTIDSFIGNNEEIERNANTIIEKIDYNFNLEDLKDVNIPNKQKRELRRGEYYGMPKYDKPKSAIKSFFEKFKQKRLTPGRKKELDEKKSIEHKDLLYKIYKEVHNDKKELDNLCSLHNLSQQDLAEFQERINEEQRKQAGNNFLAGIQTQVDTSKVLSSKSIGDTSKADKEIEID